MPKPTIHFCKVDDLVPDPRNARPIPFIPCAGTVAPLFWTPTPAVLADATASLRA